MNWIDRYDSVFQMSHMKWARDIIQNGTQEELDNLEIAVSRAQSEFFDNGEQDISDLLSEEDIVTAIEQNDRTIARSINNKFHTR